MVSLNEFPRSMILSNFLLLFVENNEKRREIGNTCAEILQDWEWEWDTFLKPGSKINRGI